MFSSALKSFSSNISSNYTLAPQPSSTSGPWKVFDAKRKQTGKAASVFVFEKKSLEQQNGGLGGRSNASSLKRAHEEVVERLKREASSLARLRHPSILELAEPVEDTRNGGLMFATEPVTASLASLLQEKDEQERSGGVAGRGSRFVVEETDGTRRRRELEIDELEIQKGLLQVGKGLEFLHESAGLVHANLTPEAILVNAKGDWKISGLAFCGPHETSTAATSLAPISLHEVLNHDPRLPGIVQLNLDYTSPDFVLDNTLTASADMFTLGLLIVSLYNSPHSSPLSTGGSLSSYRRVFSSSSNIPTQSNNFLVPRDHPLPPKLASELLPRLLTRRPAQRLSAREFQEASYFDNILVSTMRFLDALPAKTANEKAQFLRGLPRIMPQFPKSVLEKKVLPALLEEMKDRELLAPIMANMFAMVKAMPAGKRVFTQVVVPKLREVFLTNKTPDKDTSKDAGLVILLENMQIAAENCQGKEFRDDILPIILLALESTTHGLVDSALATLPFVLPVLDFTTIKNELFPVIANVFAKTSSLNIKIKGLDAFNVLCGGTATTEETADDDLNGIGIAEKKPSTASSSCILDKFTVQEKVVPLLKGIKTKEPGVMMAALRVFKQVGEVADSDFLAMEILPILWMMSLGPLLNLQQFQAFMSLIKILSGKIEKEQTKKLQEIGNSGNPGVGTGSRGRQITASVNGLADGQETDFETLVSGGRKAGASSGTDLMDEWGATVAAPARPSNPPRVPSSTPTFSWQTSAAPIPAAHNPTINALRPSGQPARTITPDQGLSSFATLTPASKFSQPLQPTSPAAVPMRPMQATPQVPYSNTSSSGTTIDWSSASASQNSSSLWANQRSSSQNMSSYSSTGFDGVGTAGTTSASAAPAVSSFGLPPPPMSPQSLNQVSSNGGYAGLGKVPQRSQQQQSGNGGGGGGLDNCVTTFHAKAFAICSNGTHAIKVRCLFTFRLGVENDDRCTKPLKLQFDTAMSDGVTKVRASSGATSAILLQPADLLKTRVQQSKSSTLTQALREILQGPNPIRSLWRGAVPSVLRTGTGSALYFGLLNQMRVHASKLSVVQNHDTSIATSNAPPKLSNLANLTTGSLARVTAGLVVNPITLLKVRYESTHYAYTSLIGAAKDILAKEGPRGFFAGFGATAVRDAPYAGLYVVIYEQCKTRLAGFTGASSSTATAGTNFASGVVAAISATTLTNPFDAIKTRLQIAPGRYGNMLRAAQMMVQLEGVRSMFSGLSMRIGRKALSSAFTWTVYEELIRRAERVVV
nr:solute carrier family 25 member 38 like [Quercus suber]